MDEITYTSLNPSAIWFVSDLFVTPSPPNSLVQRNLTAPVTLTFSGAGLANALGFFLVGVGGIPASAYRIDVTSADADMLTEIIFPGFTENIIFRGFVSDAVLSSVTISPVEVAGNISNFHLDNVSRGTSVVPESSTVTMTGTGLLALACFLMMNARVTTRLAGGESGNRLNLAGGESGNRLNVALRMLR